MRIPAICLAAGSGTRFGGAKPAADLEPGLSLGSAAVRALVGAGFAPVFVVVRPDDDLAWLESLPPGHPVRPCVCADAEQGMSRSIRRGVQAALDDEASPDAAMIALADMPFLSAGKLAEWRAAWVRNPAFDFVAGRSGGTFLPPVLWPRRKFDDLMRLDGDAGAGSLIRSGTLRGAFVELTGLESLDLDTPEQLQVARVIWQAVMRVHGAQTPPGAFGRAANSMSPKLTHP